MTVSTSDRSERDKAIIAKFEQDVMAGRVFSRSAASFRSIIGYQPPSSFRDYAKALRIFAAYAATGDRAASLVAGIMGDRAMQLHGVPGDVVARIYDAAGETVKRGYFDTIRNASPEPGRRSDNEHEYTLLDRLGLMVVLSHVAAAFVPRVPGCGWCHAALVEQERAAGRALWLPDFTGR